MKLILSLLILTLPLAAQFPRPGGAANPSPVTCTGSDCSLPSGSNFTIGTTVLASGKLYPTADSTSAWGIYRADGTTLRLSVDTTNGRFVFNNGSTPINTGGTGLGFNSPATLSGLGNIAFVSAGVEHMLKTDNIGQNVLAIWNTNNDTGCSAVRFLDYLGDEKGAIGTCGPGQSAFGGKMFIEASNFPTAASPPVDMVFGMTGTENGVQGIHHRLLLKGTDGTSSFLSLPGTALAGSAIWTADSLNNKVLNTPGTAAQPGLAGIGFTTTGLHWASNTLGLDVNGTAHFTLQPDTWLPRADGNTSLGSGYTNRFVNAFLKNLRIGEQPTYTPNLVNISRDDGNATMQSVAISDASKLNEYRFVRMGGTTASPSNVADTYELGSVRSQGYSGGTFFDTALMKLTVDGAVTNAQRPPSKIQFYTNASNAALANNMTLFGSGGLFVGSSPSDPGAGTIQPGTAYKSADGTAGASCTVGAGGATVKNGLVVACL